MWRSSPVSNHRMVRPRVVSSTAIRMLDAIFILPFDCVPGFAPAHANVDLHDCQLTFEQREALLSVPRASCATCTLRDGAYRPAGSRSGDPVERRIEFPTFPCYFLLLGQ